MIDKSSRYAATPVFAIEGRAGFAGVRARAIGPATGVIEHQLRAWDRIDLLALHYYNDARLWWRILDANPDFVFGGNILRVRATLTGGSMGYAPDTFSDPAHGVVDHMTLSIDLDGLGARTVTLGTRAAMDLKGINKDDGVALAGAITAAVRALGGLDSYVKFSCSYDDQRTCFVLLSGATAPESLVVVGPGDGSRSDLARFIKVDPKSAPIQGDVASPVLLIPRAQE